MSYFQPAEGISFTPKFRLGMSVIYMLLAISILVALIFFVAFVISVRKGQYDDSYTPSVRILFEDEVLKKETDERNYNQLDKPN